jgi:phenylalanyl-tRNA synthetase beta subunit
MEYSLYQLNKYAKLNDINLSDIVDRLNLIGFEVDDIFYERCTTDKFINNIRLLIEIPSNREDLLNEQLFLKELGTIFLFEIYQTWKDIKQTYSFLNIETSSLYQTQKVNLIKSDLSNILIYKFELENCFLSNTPIWIKQKLLNGGLVPEDNLNDLLNLIVLEYGSNITSSYFQKFTKDFIIERLQKSENFISVEKKLELIPCGSIVLRNSSDEIVLVLGYLNFLPLDNSNSLVSIEGIFL